MKTYAKKCEERHWQKQMEDLPKLLTEVDYGKFDNSEIIPKAVKLFERLSVSDFRLSQRLFRVLSMHR